MEWITQYWMEWTLGIIGSGMIAGYTGVHKRLKAQIRQQDAMKEGVKALLYDRLYRAYSYYMELGYCPVEDKKNIEHIFMPYHKLGGNGTGLHMYKQMMTMPIEPSKDKEDLT